MSRIPMRYIFIGALGAALLLSLILWAVGQRRAYDIYLSKQDDVELLVSTDRCGVSMNVLAYDANFTHFEVHAYDSKGYRQWWPPVVRRDPLRVGLPYWLTAALSGLPLAWMLRRHRRRAMAGVPGFPTVTPDPPERHDPRPA